MRRFLILLLHMILLVAAVLLAARFVVGSFRTAFVIVNSPANAAGTVAVSFLLLTLTANIDKKTGSGNLRVNQWVILASLTLIMAAAFWPNLGSAFVYDDYTHILQTSHATWRILADAFRREPGGHGLFFRPVAFISYWLDYQWAGPVAARWHAWSLAVDTANVCLLYLLTTRLGLRRMAATGAALVFALHGSRAETVAWSDARSDLLATLFCLIVLLAVLEYCRGGRKAFFVPMLLCAMLGVYTKESAFCLPLLPLTLLPFLHPGARRRAVIASGTLALGCALLFAYRWWALGGIGGYADRTGVSAVWHPSPLHSCEALCFRQWAYLFFPVNWVAPMEWWLRAAAVVFLGALIVCAGRSGASRLRLLAGIAFLLAADLPVQHLLMFQTDFAGARVLYLPVAGLAIFWGLLLEGIAQPWLKWATAAALVVFNLAALEHNLRPWRTTPEAAVRVCRALGSQMAHDPRPVVLSDLPDRKDGVYFLGNGFPECVEMNSGQPMGRVFVVGRSPAEPPVHAREFVWDAGPNRVEERHQK